MPIIVAISRDADECSSVQPLKIARAANATSKTGRWTDAGDPSDTTPLNNAHPDLIKGAV